MLLDDRHVALNDLIVLCEEAADQYLDAAEVTDDTELSTLFRELARKRERAAHELAQHVVELGALPRVPDTDKETLERLVLRMKATLSLDEPLALLRERMRTEDEIAALTDRALHVNLPEGAQAVLHRLRREASEAKARLSGKTVSLR